MVLDTSRTYLEKIILASMEQYSEVVPASKGRHNLGGPIPRSLEKAFIFLSNYFEKKNTFPIPWEVLNLDRFTPLEREVFRYTAQIPFGGIVAYKDIAKSIGREKAARFVGSTLAKNPYPIMIPCHRVVSSDGGLGGFSAGTGWKRRLLEFENNRI